MNYPEDSSRIDDEYSVFVPESVVLQFLVFPDDEHARALQPIGGFTIDRVSNDSWRESGKNPTVVGHVQDDEGIREVDANICLPGRWRKGVAKILDREVDVEVSWTVHSKSASEQVPETYW